jgi:hypothetical protein
MEHQIREEEPWWRNEPRHYEHNLCSAHYVKRTVRISWEQNVVSAH